MKIHGLTIGIERVDDDFFLSLKAKGTLTHQDYERIIPMIESSINSIKFPHIKVFADITELKSWTLRAAWDDFKIGLKYGNKFEKIAIYGNKDCWQELGVKVGKWFISGEIKKFSNQEDALNWLHNK